MTTTDNQTPPATNADITNADGIAADYHTTKPTALSWYHKGIIPAVVANGRVIRFSRKAVAQALAEAAKPTNTGRARA